MFVIKVSTLKTVKPYVKRQCDVSPNEWVIGYHSPSYPAYPVEGEWIPYTHRLQLIDYYQHA